MIEPELKQQLEQINKNVESVSKKMGGTWAAFFRGLLAGFASIIGVALAILLIGWVLNTLGYIPVLRNQANEWKAILQQAQQRQIIDQR